MLLEETGNSQGPTHSRLAECGSRQTIQSRPGHSNRVVSSARGLPVDMHQPQADLFATWFNNKLLQFVSPVPDSLAWAVDALSLP